MRKEKRGEDSVGGLVVEAEVLVAVGVCVEMLKVCFGERIFLGLMEVGEITERGVVLSDDDFISSGDNAIDESPKLRSVKGNLS